MDEPRLRAVYELAVAAGEAAARAREIAIEQTVEIPEGCFSARIERAVVGRVEELAPLADGRQRAVVSYPLAAVGAHLAQLVNLLYGNVSMHRGIRLAAVDWPAELVARFPGPRHGVAGLRALTGVGRRPLVCAAIKPLGKDVAELARDAAAFAAGGVDVVKDDHSLDEQEALAPFRERVARCQEAVVAAAAAAGGRTLYFPNLTGSPGDLDRRLALLAALGICGATVAPMLLGLETVRWLADSSGLALLAHPTFAGAFFGDDHGIAPEVLLGQIFRLAGCDGVIFVNAGGRFAWTTERCDAIVRALRAPLAAAPPALPVPAGGVDVARAPAWAARYGRDTMILIGGSFYRRGDLRAASAALVAALEEVG